MFKAIKRSNWVTGILIFFMPVMLIFFLASQMAYSQVKSKFEAYQSIPEVTRLVELEGLPAGQLVLLRGRISEATPLRNEVAVPDLIIFQERPADGREVRFREEFDQVFPEFVMDLPDGAVVIVPSLTRERVIQTEHHTVSDGDRQRTGFRIGDTVMVQGQWQPGHTMAPTLAEVTGITSADRHSLMIGWQNDFKKVNWVRNGLGFLTVLGIILLVVQLRWPKVNNKLEEKEEWQTPKTKIAPTT